MINISKKTLCFFISSISSLLFLSFIFFKMGFNWIKKTKNPRKLLKYSINKEFFFFKINFVKKMRIEKEKKKTQYCLNFLEIGVCKYGENCDFAHGGEKKEFERDIKYKTKTCESFENGVCPYGTKCSFIHNVNNDPFVYFKGINIKSNKRKRLNCFKNMKKII